ncbi:glycosyltransferase family 2 protein [Patescibacteria group bacterium]
MKDHKVSIVIPNWNGVHLLKKHLKKVVRSSGKSEIIIVDDGSTDDSVAYIKANYPDIRLITSQKNVGFARAVNLGVKNTTCDIVVLLNTDIEPEIGWLKPLLSHFEDDLVFAVACMDKSHEGGEVFLRGRGKGEWKRGFYVHRRGEVNKPDTDWVSGGSGAYRKSIWDELGGMDESFNPFYWEDIDLSYRAVDKGYKLVFEPKAIVHHYHEKGKIKTDFTPNKVKTIASRNQFIFIWKHIKGIDNVLKHSLFTPLNLLKTFLSGDLTFITGYIKALKYIPRILSYRTNTK